MIVSSSRDISSASTLEILRTVMPTTLKTSGTKGTPATVRCLKQLVCRPQSKPPQQYQQGSNVANSIDRAKAGMPATERQHS
jgi:hypothetical protein